MADNDTIHFIFTGGTIDSYYDGTKDTAVPNKTSVIPRFIENLKLYNKNTFTQICMKDSRNLDEKDRVKILENVEKSESNKIVITHGTYTMPDTARYLKARLKRTGQTIILTGSMIPIDGFTFSDGPFNLGFSIAQLQVLKSGIYVCMNGRVFSPDEIIKQLSQGRFISVFGETETK